MVSSVVLKAVMKGRSHRYCGCNYLSLPLIPASVTPLLESLPVSDKEYPEPHTWNREKSVSHTEEMPIKSLRPGQNDSHFQMHFCVRKLFYFDSNFTEVCSYCHGCQYVSIDLGNRLAPPGHNPLPESMLTQMSDDTGPQWHKDILGS